MSSKALGRLVGVDQLGNWRPDRPAVVLQQAASRLVGDRLEHEAKLGLR